MARKVFISFLGTNNYLECRYDFGNSKMSSPVRFVQEAFVEQLCSEWTENDCVYIFCTTKEKTGADGAKEINWFDNGQPRASDETERIGLQNRLANLRESRNLKVQIEEVDIATGFDENEIWDIFNIIYHKLRPSDMIYLDVTHAFRSIPLFSIVLFNYSRFMKGTELVSVLYGAFEKLGPSVKVRELPVEKRIAPIIDMTNIVRLQEYNQMASELKRFGRVKSLKDAISIIGSDQSNQPIRDLGKSIAELDEYIATIDLPKIKSGSFISKFRNNYKSVRKSSRLKEPVANILQELYDETSDFMGSDSYQNIEAAINWTIKHDMLMQTYPLAEEYIVMRVADMFNDIKPSSFSKKEYRMFVSSILGIPEDDFKLRNWREKLAQYPDVADDLAEDFLIKELRPLYDRIRTARNSLAHGNGAIKYKELKEGIPNIIECISYLNAGYKQYPSTKAILAVLC